MTVRLDNQDPLVPLSAPKSAIPIPKPFPIWSGWDVLAMVLFFCLATFIVALIAQGTWYLLSVSLDNFSTLNHSSYHGIVHILVANLLNGLTLLFIYWTITFKYKAPFWTSIKWRNRSRTRTQAYLFIGALLAITMGALSSFIPESQELPIGKLLSHTETAILLGIMAVFVAPFVEEVIFRGFIYPVIEHRWGQTIGVTLTALMFASLHITQLWGSWIAVGGILFVGLVLSLVRAMTDSLFPSFLLHLSYNTTLCLLSLLGFFLETRSAAT